MDFLSQKQRQQMCSYHGISTNENNQDKVNEISAKMKRLSIEEKFNNQVKIENNIENNQLNQS